MIYAIDMDHTLCKEVCYKSSQCSKATPIESRIKRVNRKFEEDFVIIYTARRRHLVPATLEWLERHHVRFHAFQYGVMKMPFDKYVDADAVHPDNL